MVIAFDPGVTTGIAVLDSGGSVVSTEAISAEEFVDTDRAAHYSMKHPDADVVIEAPPQFGQYRFITQSVEEALKRVFPNAAWVQPGQWKGHPAARPDSSLSGKTQHEKDTVGLGRWFLAREEHLARSRSS